MASCWPCCGNSLQRGASIVAFIDLLFALVSVVFFLVTGSILFVIITAIQNGDPNIDQSTIPENVQNLSSDQLEQLKIITIPWIVFAIVGFIIEVVLFLVLRAGSRDKNYTRCKIWLLVRIVFLLFAIASSIYNIVRGRYTIGHGVLDIFLLYRIYTFVVVKSYMNELLRERRNAAVEKNNRLDSS